MALQFEDEIFSEPIALEKIVPDVFVAPTFEEFGGIGLEGVDAGKSFRRFIIPGEELAGGVFAELLTPLFHEPFGVGPAEGGLGDFHVREDFADVIGFAEVAAENGVDEAGLGTVAGALGHLDGFVDGGMGWDAVQPKNLVEAEAEEILDGGALVAAGGGFAGDEAI